MAVIFAGDTHSVQITVTEAGAPVSLAGAEFALIIAQTAAGPALVSKSTNDFTINSNVATCQLSSADTELAPGVYYMEVRVKDVDGHERRAADVLEVKESVT